VGFAAVPSPPTPAGRPWAPSPCLRALAEEPSLLRRRGGAPQAVRSWVSWQRSSCGEARPELLRRRDSGGAPQATVLGPELIRRRGSGQGSG
jgi:hypothetical protein